MNRQCLEILQSILKRVASIRDRWVFDENWLDSDFQLIDAMDQNNKVLKPKFVATFIVLFVFSFLMMLQLGMSFEISKIETILVTDTTSAKTLFISVVRSKPYLPICGIITAGL